MKRVATACMVLALCISTVLFPTAPPLNIPAVAQNFASPGFPESPPPVAQIDCSQVYERGYDKQTNFYAGQVRIQCGLEPGGQLGPMMSAPSPMIPGQSSNVPLITDEGPSDFPHVTQSESMIAVNPTPNPPNIVVMYNDSRGVTLSPINIGGVSFSLNGGLTFDRVPPPAFTGGGANFGDPILVYNKKFGAFFGGWIMQACGGFGLGVWSSTNGATWTPSACVHVGTGDDRPSMWVDNNSSSPFYGEMYVSYNNFAAGAVLQVVHTLPTCAVCWSPPISLTSTFIRNVQLTGSPGPDGTVFVAAMDEGGGGFNLRQNQIFRSTNGGASWAQVYAGPLFQPAGDSLCSTNSYFAQVDPIWRFMSWGQPAVGPAMTVHYAYAGVDLDPGDIFYITSTDNGATWSDPIVLNADDGSGVEHWMPSLSATATGKVQVSWYDRRNTTDGFNYQYFGITSLDGGGTWGSDFPISDILISQPAQPDPSIVNCYAGDYNYHVASGTTNYMTWTDGRVSLNGTPQQDVFFDQLP